MTKKRKKQKLQNYSKLSNHSLTATANTTSNNKLDGSIVNDFSIVSFLHTPIPAKSSSIYEVKYLIFKVFNSNSI
jgi:hypothetical protein